jgi:hypothetical protein
LCAPLACEIRYMSRWMYDAGACGMMNVASFPRPVSLFPVQFCWRLIVGGVIGGLALLDIGIAAISFICIRPRKQQSAGPAPGPAVPPQVQDIYESEGEIASPLGNSTSWAAASPDRATTPSTRTRILLRRHRPCPIAPSLCRCICPSYYISRRCNSRPCTGLQCSIL